jgi:uncharacterized membrane protein YtjA (UPF0391 family)
MPLHFSITAVARKAPLLGKTGNFLEEVKSMLRWAILFLIIALIASAFGFFGVEGIALTAAKICAVVFIILAILSFIGGGLRTPPV